MADGRETRATIDSETVKGLLLINGGGAVALLAFLPGVLQKSELASLARAIIYSVFTFQLGLVCAVIHNRFRRLCSMEYAKEDLELCSFFGIKLKRPCICQWSIGFMWASIVLFLMAGVIVLVAGLGVVGVSTKSKTTPIEKSAILIKAPPNKASQPTPKSGAAEL